MGYLIHIKKAKSQTIKSYISAIRVTLKNEGIKLNEDLFLMNSLMKACKLQNDYIRTRLPIWKPLLIELQKLNDIFAEKQLC